MQEIAPGFWLIDKIHSNVDSTIKFVCLSQGQVLEFSYIDKRDGKDIICVPTQTACRLGCQFCFLSDYSFPVRNLKPEEIAIGVKYVVSDLHLRERSPKNEVLLVSYMGCGEPLLNLKNLIATCERITKDHKASYRVVRFGVASLIPKPALMRKLIDAVREKRIPLKFHLSLHSPFDKVRHILMPAASPVRVGIDLLQEFMAETGNSTEIHYALIDGVNDRVKDMRALIRLIKGHGIPVKFLAYNRKPDRDFEPSKRVAEMRQMLEAEGIKTEYYNPPGSDIGSSCGQFLMDYYKKYNTRPTRN